MREARTRRARPNSLRALLKARCTSRCKEVREVARAAQRAVEGSGDGEDEWALVRMLRMQAANMGTARERINHEGNVLMCNHGMQVTQEANDEGVSERWQVGEDASLYAGYTRVEKDEDDGKKRVKSCTGVRMGNKPMQVTEGRRVCEAWVDVEREGRPGDDMRCAVWGCAEEGGFCRRGAASIPCGL